ncbi:sigma-70 family RNA polymerase sigma factor [Paenarthrobacter nitroguajacolicus]|uniref:sigma-70 family RNA polymerase sigma factor n=1 Tax=Paenarthrobacter nitroguajacolicus TaxID=211146 RepID=UPI00285C9846|nr:sigma-70 family RNA polymerase sigma factor [Paenarthrobacter nitroguajacolicus]MDR6640111.1 RNA polymerase sigma factor (sigma-70 family) [Paenarthrobacter nitroguajacolicus]
MDQVFAGGAGGASPTFAMASGSDPQIMSLVREGVTEAFDVLYQRHLKVAQYVARAQTDNPSDADDVVAESFASIFQLLKEGKGPKEFFRSYLLTVVRRTAHDRNRKARRMPTAADEAILDSPVLDNDPVLSDLESSIMAKAFKSLPERWQAVLWHLDIEGLKPAAAAPFVGLTPNGVSSLAIRAREGLRQAYLQQHISQTVDQACDEYASQLGKYARNALKRTSQEKVTAHLEGCAHCTALLIELNDVQGGMRTILFPLVTGIAFTPGVIAAIGSGALSGTASSGAGSTAVPGKVGLQSGSRAWQLVASIVLGAAALAGLLVWLMQLNAGSQSAAENNTATIVPPVHETSAPSTSPSPGIGPTSTPSSESAAVPPAAKASQLPAVEVPPTERARQSAVVVDSGTVFSTTAPGVSASSSPLTQTVDATFAAAVGSTSTDRELRVGFSLQGDGTPTTGEVVFALPDQAAFVEGRAVAPNGWTCATDAANTRQLRCTTDSLNAADLSFTLGVDMPPAADGGTVSYRFAGQGIVPKSFANTVH